MSLNVRRHQFDYIGGLPLTITRLVPGPHIYEDVFVWQYPPKFGR